MSGVYVSTDKEKEEEGEETARRRYLRQLNRIYTVVALASTMWTPWMVN